MATEPRTRAGALNDLLRSTNLPVILTLAALVVGLAALLPLVQSSGATTTAGNIRLLEQQKTDWQARLREKELEVASLGSLDRIEKEAALRWKMVTPTDVRYITVPAPAPDERKLPTRYLPPEPGEQGGGSSVWEDLFGWLPLP